MPLLYNLARMTVSSSGTGTITLNAAVTGFATFDLAGCSTAVAGTSINYAINDTTQSEIGYGTYISSAKTLTRNILRTSAGSTSAAITMSNAAQVFITPPAEGILSVIGLQSFSSNSTYTPSAGMIYCIIECAGGGGGGGGGSAAAGALQVGGGGGGGGYAMAVVPSTGIGASQTVTIGAGGAGGVGAAIGSSGATTSVGTLCSAGGGGGGGISAAGTGAIGGAGGSGGVSSAGTVQAAGNPGTNGLGTSLSFVITGGGGGNPKFGGGGAPLAAANTGSSGSNYGGGGGGGASSNGAGANNGGAGAAGYVLITEFSN